MQEAINKKSTYSVCWKAVSTTGNNRVGDEWCGRLKRKAGEKRAQRCSCDFFSSCRVLLTYHAAGTKNIAANKSNTVPLPENMQF